MEDNVLDVVGEGVEAPELVVDPEGSCGERIVLLGGSRGSPKLKESLPQLKGPLHVNDPFVVIEDQCTGEAGPVYDNCAQHEG